MFKIRIGRGTRGVASFIFLLIFGIVFTAAGIFFIPDNDIEYLETQGTIVEIERLPGINNDGPSYQVYVDYEVDGVSYEHAEYNSYSSGMEIGSSVDIQYSADDPAIIRAPGTAFIPYLFIAVGVGTVIYSFVYIIKRSRV